MNYTLTLVTAILLALPSALLGVDFSFDAPAGPTFSEPEKAAQREAGARVLPMVMEAFEKGADSVRIPAGDYRFGKSHWDRDGVVYALEFAKLQREDAHPFTIDATGTTLWFDMPDQQAPAAYFCVGFKDCRNVILKGATIDRATRGHVEGRITRFDFPGNRIELQLSPGITVPTTFSGNLEQRVIPFKADGTFCAPLYALQAGGVHLKYTNISPASSDGRCWVSMGDTKLLDTIKAGGLLRIGDGLSCVYTVTAGLEIIRSSRLVMEGIRVYAAKAWGLERDGGGAHVWRDCYFGPRPGTSQWQGGDGFMFNATRYGTTLDRVTILHTTDDTANFHGYWSPVARVEGDRVLFAENAETRRTLPHDLRLSDSVIFLDRETGEELGRGKVTAIEGGQVTLDRPTAAFANALAWWPDHACAGWLIQNCEWHDNYQRLLVQSGPGTIRNCRFTRFGSALELNSVLSYVEGGVPHDIRIENNTFTDINPQPGGAAITVYSHAYQYDKMPVMRNITITGNTFHHPNEKVITLEGVDGVRIEGNHFPGKLNPVRLKRCANAGVQE